MNVEKFFIETNSVPADLLSKVSEFIELHYSSEKIKDKLIMIDFYYYLEKRYLDHYVLIFCDENDLFSIRSEKVTASLLLWEQGVLKDTEQWEKDLFVKEHGFFDFNFFIPERI